MLKFLKRKSDSLIGDDVSSSKQSRPEINLDNLPTDPGLRPPIMSYHPNDRDQIRRAYLQMGPHQPHNHDFPLKKFGQQHRRFHRAWFTEFLDWLEYSIEKDVAFCLCCYLFKQQNQPGGDSFVSGGGFSNWKIPIKFATHVGGPASAHNKAVGRCRDLLKEKQHIQTVFVKQADQARFEYRTRLNATVECIRFLLEGGLAFRGHDESEDSYNPGNFIRLLKFLSRNCPDIRAITLMNAPQNLKLIALDIQKDVVRSCALKTIKVIISDLGDAPFSVLVDEARDLSVKEQMAIVIRFVDKEGNVIEQFLGVEHAANTNSLTLKKTIENVFCRHGLTISRLRGQGYDGASNMQGEFKGLRTLTMNENPCAYYIHCFAHQLQLAVVAVAKRRDDIEKLFMITGKILNVVGGSCKRRDMLREKQATRVIEALENGELSSGKGLNQETSLKRAGETRWGSHYHTLCSLMSMFDDVTDVLEIIGKNSSESDKRVKAQFLMNSMNSFEFVFSLFLMKQLLAITNELSQALQRQDQDIVNAMKLVQLSKDQLQQMRESGWNSLLGDVSAFCIKHDTFVCDMDDKFAMPGQKRRNREETTNLHHYRFEIFNTLLDSQLVELNDRFTDSNTELLLFVACLSPCDSFAMFDKIKVIRLAEFYPKDFNSFQLTILHDQLDTYIADMRSSDEFGSLDGIGDLGRVMVKTKRNKVYPLVYLLLTLALVLPVATALLREHFQP